MATTSMIRISTEAASPSRWSASVFGTRPKSASLALMSSTRMNAVDARPSDVAREKRAVNQQVPSRRWPLAAPEGHAMLADLQYDWSTRAVPKLLTILMVPNVRPS